MEATRKLLGLFDTMMTVMLCCNPVAVTAQAESGVRESDEPTQWVQGTYIWDSRNLLDPSQRISQLNYLQSQGIQRLMVGLTSQQIAQGSRTEPALRDLLAAARQRHLRVSLLLGDPDWLTPEKRPTLLELIRRYRQIEFDGLHLDLEVEQLGWPVPAERIRQWLLTVLEAHRLSPWPISISSHPRWFEPPPPGTLEADWPCVPCKLAAVETVSLMIYQRPAELMLARSKAIAQQWPRLRFRVVQSVEPQLSLQESWHGTPAAELQRQVSIWRPALNAAGVNGIDWQDWSNYPLTSQP
jgi:hypothetical protein